MKTTPYLEAIKNKKLTQANEGLSPIYKNGRITPDTRGLGPEYEKDIKYKKVIPEKKVIPKKKAPIRRINIKNLA